MTWLIANKSLDSSIRLPALFLSTLLSDFQVPALTLSSKPRDFSSLPLLMETHPSPDENRL